MTTAAWWWARQPVGVEAPRLVDLSQQDILVGQNVDLFVDNVGGGADSWDVEWLPNGLSYDQFPDRLRIYGIVGPMQAPVVVIPEDQSWYVGQPIDLRINLDLDAGDPATSIVTDELPSGLSVTETTQTYIRITGLAGAPVIDQADIVDRTYYEGQSFDFEIKNIGDGAATWDVDQLPNGLVAETIDGFTVRIHGTVIA